MRIQSILALACATLVAAIPHPQTDDPNGPADDPIQLIVTIWTSDNTCSDNVPRQTVTGNGCVNKTLAAGGFAKVRASIASPNGFVTGYTGAGCTGEIAVVFSAADQCQPIGDVSVLSWRSGAPFDEGGN
jgi:hypothetical protein